MSDRNGPLRTRVLKGLSWSLLQTWGTHLVTFIVFLVTARLLGPDAFGTVVTAYTVLGALTMVVDLLVDGLANYSCLRHTRAVPMTANGHRL